MKIAGAAARRFLDKPDPQMRAALVFGPNRALVHDAARALTQAALKGEDDPFALTRLGEDELKRDKARLEEALFAQSLLGGARVVWARIDGAGADEPLLAALKAIEDGADCAHLIIEGGDLGGSAKLVKAFDAAKRAASMVFYEESPAERHAFAQALLKDAGVALSREAAEALAALLPEDRGVARREIDKLAAYAHGAATPLSAAEIEALLPDEGEGAIDAAIAAALDGRGAEAAEALARIEGLSGVSAIKAMERRVMRLLETCSFIDQGLSPTDAAGKLRPPVFWKERDRFQAHLRTWRARTLTRALDALWRAEIAAKTAQSPQALLAADAFAKVAALAGR